MNARGVRLCMPIVVAACVLAGCQAGGGAQDEGAQSARVASRGGTAPHQEQPMRAPQEPVELPAPARADFDRELRAAYDAYRAGEFEQSIFGYERVLARADDPRDQVRALISIAMIRLLPSSKAHDIDAAAIVMEELGRRVKQHGLEYEFFGQLELLGLIQGYAKDTRELRAANARLRKSLADKEELVRQLRALSVDGD